MRAIRYLAAAAGGAVLTLTLSGTAASLCGLSFIGTDLFAGLVSRVMELDGRTGADPAEYFRAPGLWGAMLCLAGIVCLVCMLWCAGELIRMAVLRLMVLVRPAKRPDEELPTAGMSAEELFARMQTDADGSAQSKSQRDDGAP